jgi:ATP-dependent Clp protease ATP-binding subunit ClpC
VFERFTDRARQVVVLAQDEARLLKHNYIGTEHLLLGLLREEEGIAADVLESLDISIVDVRAQIARIVGQGDEVTTGQIPFTPRAKKALQFSSEALSFGHEYIGTEHILLGVTRVDEGVAAQILHESGVDPKRVREAVLRQLPGARQQERSRRISAALYRRRHDRGKVRVSPLALSAIVAGIPLALTIGILIGWAIWGT